MTLFQNSAGTAYAASSRQPSTPRSSQYVITSRTSSWTAGSPWFSSTSCCSPSNTSAVTTPSSVCSLNRWAAGASVPRSSTSSSPG